MTLNETESRALARDGREWPDIPWHILRPVQLELFSSPYKLPDPSFWQQLGAWMLGEGPDPRANHGK